MKIQMHWINKDDNLFLLMNNIRFSFFDVTISYENI